MTHYESKALPDAEIAKLVDRLAPLLSAKGIKCYSVPALVAAWCDYCTDAGVCAWVSHDDSDLTIDFMVSAHHYLQPVKEEAK